MRTLQQEIITELKVQPTIDPEAEIRRSIDFMKAYLHKHSFLKTLVLGISGGQDSTLCGKLCQMAITELRAETGDDSYKFIAVRLPYGTQADESDALDAIEFMQADEMMRVNGPFPVIIKLVLSFLSASARRSPCHPAAYAEYSIIHILLSANSSYHKYARYEIPKTTTRKDSPSAPPLPQNKRP